MKIPLNDDYQLASDKYQWMVQKKDGQHTKGKLRGQTKWKSLSYHPTATKAINHHADVMFRTSDAKSVDEAIKEAKRIATELTEALQAPEFEVHIK